MKAFTEMTKAELLEQGFRMWDNTSDLMLIPASRYDEVPLGTQVTGIFGDVRTKDETSGDYKLPDGTPNPNYIDLDHRGGLLAFGIYPTDADARRLKETKAPW
jgi:hypothetical protein